MQFQQPCQSSRTPITSLVGACRRRLRCSLLPLVTGACDLGLFVTVGFGPAAHLNWCSGFCRNGAVIQTQLKTEDESIRRVSRQCSGRATYRPSSAPGGNALARSGECRRSSDALVGYEKLHQVRTRQQDTLADLQETVRVSTLRYKGGTTTYLEVLDGQRSHYGAELTLAAERADEYRSLVQLYKALDGG
jgi:hypothetical protein